MPDLVVEARFPGRRVMPAAHHFGCFFCSQSPANASFRAPAPALKGFVSGEGIWLRGRAARSCSGDRGPEREEAGVAGLPRAIKLLFSPPLQSLFFFFFSPRMSMLNELLLVNDESVLGRSEQGWEVWPWRLCTFKSRGAVAQGSQLCIKGVAAAWLIPILGHGYFGYPVLYIYLCIKRGIEAHVSGYKIYTPR